MDLIPRWQLFLPSLDPFKGSVDRKSTFQCSPGTASISPGSVENEGEASFYSLFVLGCL